MAAALLVIAAGAAPGCAGRDFARAPSEPGFNQAEIENIANPVFEGRGDEPIEAPTREERFISSVRTGSIRGTEKLLKGGASSNLRDERGAPALMLAAARNDPEMVTLLLHFGADVNGRDRHEATALMAAARFGARPAALALLAHGAKANAVAENGAGPLLIGVAKGHFDVVKALLQYGADVNASTRSGYTPLHAAALREDVAIAKALLDRGADPDTPKRGDGIVPLMIAAFNGDIPLIRLLLDRGANPGMTDQGGATPLDFALRGGKGNAAAELQTAIARARAVTPVG